MARHYAGFSPRCERTNQNGTIVRLHRQGNRIHTHAIYLYLSLYERQVSSTFYLHEQFDDVVSEAQQSVIQLPVVSEETHH